MDVKDQELLTRELRRREAYLAEAQKLSHIGSFGWNPLTGEIVWSDETFRIFEFAPSSKVLLPMILERVHPQDMPAVEMAIGAATRGEEIDLEHRLVMPDGRIKCLHVVGKAESGETGDIEVIGAVMDITARKLTEIELRRSETYLAEAQRLSHTGSFGCKASSGEMFWSEETFRIFGYDRDAKPAVEAVLKRVHPDDKAMVQAQISHATSQGKDCNLEYRLLLPDDSVKHVHVVAHAVKDEAGNVEFVGAVTDITERKAAEERIRRQEAELRQILDLAPQQVRVYGPGGERLYANRIALDYYGVSLKEWQQTTGLSFRSSVFVHPDDRERATRDFDANRSRGSAYESELRVRGADGHYRWFLARHNPLHDDNGQVKRWYVGLTDIDERKRAEERLQQENVALREEINKASMFEEIVGTSPALQAVLSRISKVAPSDSTVLITGETGTGKELVARAIHRRSHRASRAFVSVNCAAIPRDLIASELFGHEKGAFTGATQQRLGRFELANGGTLFLDEVGELPAETQIALLRVLQECEFERVGGTRRIRADVRVIAATNRDLQGAIRAGSFRNDLFYRLHVFPIEIPSLRERRADIPLLVEYFIDRYARKAGKNIKRVNKKTLELLQSYPWPGNIRELQNVIERSVIVCETENFSVDKSWLSQQPRDTRLGCKLPFSQMVAATETEVIEEALRESQGRVFGPSGAASRLGIARSTLESKIRSLNINKRRFKAELGS
jgi:PAS domain S-box-containing protein